MQIFTAVGMGAFFLMGLVVGVRLVALGWRSRQWPELLVGAGLLCLGPLSFPAAVTGIRLLDTRPELGAPILAYAVAMLAVGGSCAAVFTYLVFRRGSALARLGAVVVPVGLATCWVVTAHTSGFDLRGRGMDLSGGVAFLLRAFALGWAAAESLRYWHLLRRRLALGLADPLTTNRFALWGIGIGAGSLITLVALVGSTRSPDQLVMSDGLNLVISFLGLVAAVTLFLAFLPPARYRSFIEGRAAAGRSPAA
jgi:hypothetical protein